jgi:flagellar biosynthesis/type III secretory pathway M-ring protein FliF/YscJ
MQYLLAALILAAIVWFVSVPLRRPRRAEEAGEAAAEARLADLEARKEAKYREIREAELDHAQGKTSDADHAALDAQLRGEAVEILRELDDARGQNP